MGALTLGVRLQRLDSCIEQTMPNSRLRVRETQVGVLRVAQAALCQSS